MAGAGTVFAAGVPAVGEVPAEMTAALAMMRDEQKIGRSHLDRAAMIYLRGPAGSSASAGGRTGSGQSRGRRTGSEQSRGGRTGGGAAGGTSGRGDRYPLGGWRD